MCVGAAVLGRIKRLVYAAPDPKSGAAGSVYDLARSDRLNHRMEVIGGLKAPEAGRLLKEFFQARRRGAGAVLNGLDSKSSEGFKSSSVGSNPTLSATPRPVGAGRVVSALFVFSILLVIFLQPARGWAEPIRLGHRDSRRGAAPGPPDRGPVQGQGVGGGGSFPAGPGGAPGQDPGGRDRSFLGLHRAGSDRLSPGPGPGGSARRREMLPGRIPERPEKRAGLGEDGAGQQQLRAGDDHRPGRAVPGEDLLRPGRQDEGGLQDNQEKDGHGHGANLLYPPRRFRRPSGRLQDGVRLDHGQGHPHSQVSWTICGPRRPRWWWDRPWTAGSGGSS